MTDLDQDSPGDSARPAPGAGSPQLLARLLDSVARGIRTTRGLQEALGVQAQTVRAYVATAAWLGLTERQDPVELSPLGLEYVFAGLRRPAVYTRAVWSVPLAAELLVASDGRLPELEAVERALKVADPELAAATLQRRASALRSLLAPVVGRPRPRPQDQEDRQLGLPLGHASLLDRTPRLVVGQQEFDPDAYRYVLANLIDHGELSLGQIRALLDRAGADGMALGGIVGLAGSRGDAVRLTDRLVVTAGAVDRRDLAAATPSILLSDPSYRAYLADAVAARHDRRAEIRRDAAASRYRSWDRRLFGHALNPERVDQDLERVLLERPLAAFPLARPGEGSPRVVEEPFLDAWELEGLPIALPPSLAQLQGGLAAVNRIFRQARNGPDVSIPDLAYRPMAVHSALLHPGEPLPRAVPDARTLRQRVLMHTPYAALLAALLLLHRQRPDRVAVVVDRSGFGVKVAGRRSIPLLEALDDFARSRGWIPCRRAQGGLHTAIFVSALEVLGIVVTVGRSVVLSEPLHARFGSDAEEMEIHQRLRPLAEALDAFFTSEEGSPDPVGPEA